jgi:hypothetical protein
VSQSRAVRDDDPGRTQAALGAIGMPETSPDFDVTRGLLRGFFAPLLAPDRHAIGADRAVAMGETVKLKRTLMRLPGKLMFLFRIRFGLYAVLAWIGAELDWAALEDELAGDAAR